MEESRRTKVVLSAIQQLNLSEEDKALLCDVARQAFLNPNLFMGKKIYQMREGRSISRKDFAEKTAAIMSEWGVLNIPPSAIYKIESGQRGVSAYELLAMAKVLGCSAESFAPTPPPAHGA